MASMLLGAALVVTNPATGPASAQGGCVTRAEFKAVKVGMRIKRVHEIFGTPGNDTGLGSPNTMRYYAVCRASGMVQVTYSPRNRVVSKSGNWFR
jgi:hypothetical protein